MITSFISRSVAVYNHIDTQIFEMGTLGLNRRNIATYVSICQYSLLGLDAEVCLYSDQRCCSKVRRL